MGGVERKSVQAGQKAIYRNDDIPTSYNTEKKGESTIRDEESAQDSQNCEWTPGDIVDKMLDEARRMDPAEWLSDEIQEDPSHMIEWTIVNEIESNLKIETNIAGVTMMTSFSQTNSAKKTN